MTEKQKILIVDDDESICEILAISLNREGHSIETKTDPLLALSCISSNDYDLVIQDIRMHQMDGIELLKKIKQIKPALPVVIITAFSTWDSAVEAMRLGAYDYIKKPFDIQLDIKNTVKRALSTAKKHQDKPEAIFVKLGIVTGYSRHIRSVWDLVRKASLTDTTCLIQGESGSGKELVARALHYLSARSSNAFVPVSCGAIPEQLLESELFGYVKGAFTDAFQDKSGLFEVATNGTLFLDEISEMSPKLQVKLLRVLEEKEYRPIGDTKTRKVDVRVIAATNKDLAKEVDKNRFRRDLYYRLNVIPINVPPLRERIDDIPVLSDYFLKKYSAQFGKNVNGFSNHAKVALCQYQWPGNVRELENCIQRAITLCDQHIIDEQVLFGLVPTHQVQTETQIPSDGLDLEQSIKNLELSMLKKALQMSGGNHTKAAQLLKLSLSSFRYKIQKYGLDKP